MSSDQRKIRVLVAKPGLDGHDRGAKVIAAAFRDAGFEVIYTGLHQTPEMIVSAAIQEDVKALQSRGIGQLFGPGTTTGEAIAYVRSWFEEHRRAEA